ncbi:MAG: Mfa1 fimbrilin C-terminal domain-containing protein, partial [Prevotella sp.]|nr:Mfa1 fimbrilin C-terminal domain-containing protein [Prevotella sp.]
YKELILDAKEGGYGDPLYNAVNKILSNWKLTYTSENKPTQGEFTYNPTVANGEKVITLNVDTCAQILNEAEGMNLTVNFKKEDSDEDDELIMSLAANAGITVYEATNENDEDGWGYYCYYFYWNRHNDNGLSGKMGQMEFATVRNNVYKLSVSKINQLGHPRDTKHDPDPVDPNDPDEDPTNYLKVN